MSPFFKKNVVSSDRLAHLFWIQVVKRLVTAKASKVWFLCQNKCLLCKICKSCASTDGNIKYDGGVIVLDLFVHLSEELQVVLDASIKTAEGYCRAHYVIHLWGLYTLSTLRKTSQNSEFFRVTCIHTKRGIVLQKKLSSLQKHGVHMKQWWFFKQEKGRNRDSKYIQF